MHTVDAAADDSAAGAFDQCWYSVISWVVFQVELESQRMT